MPTNRSRLLAALAAMIPSLAWATPPQPMGCDVPTIEQMIQDSVADLKPCEAPGATAAEIY